MRNRTRQTSDRTRNTPIGLSGIAQLATLAMLAALLAWPFAAPLRAQEPPASSSAPLTLQQAVQIAIEKNPERKAALADTRAASADVKQAWSYLLPHADFSETATVGNDPVYVFGSELRQQRFTSADFALTALNTPSPFGNFATRLGGTWNLFDSLASWRAVHRAEHMKDAASQQLERADQEIVFQVVDSYYGLLLAQRQLGVAQKSLETAQAILDESKNRYESGVVVESDYLSAQVRLGIRKQDLIRARNDVELARAQLNTAMGLPAEAQFDPADSLTETRLPDVSLEDMEKTAVEKRPDLERVRSEEAAQQQSVAIAKSSFGPRVNAFADWEADNPNLFSGGGSDWMAGVEVQFDLFSGGAKRAQLAHERAVEDRVSAVKEMATNAIRLEVRRAYYDLDAARQKVDVAHTTIAEAQESLRINQNRYDSGLSTISDLLAVEEDARRSQTDYWQAVYHYHTAYANLELASGTLSPQSRVVIP